MLSEPLRPPNHQRERTPMSTTAINYPAMKAHLVMERIGLPLYLHNKKKTNDKMCCKEIIIGSTCNKKGTLTSTSTDDLQKSVEKNVSAVSLGFLFYISLDKDA